MIVGLVVTFTLLAASVASKGQYVITCPNSTVKAEAGSNITISFQVDPPVNLSAETLDIKRNDSKAVVHSYRHYKDDHGPQVDQYRKRTALNHTDLHRGIISLNICTVNQSDEGPFKVSVPGLMATCVFHLDVVERNQLNKTIRNNSSTTEQTEKTVTKSNNHDAAMKVTIGIVCIIPVVIPIVLLVKFKKIWICMLIKKLKGNKGGRNGDNLMTQKEEKKTDTEMQSLT